MPRVLFLTSGRNTPTTRYRIRPYLPRLRALGFQCDVAESRPDKYGSYWWLGWRRSQALKRFVRRMQWRRARTRKYDAIVLEREIFDDPNWEMEAAFRSITPRFLLDVDDAIFLRYPEKFEKIAGLCDHILAGNRLLADVCRRHCPQVSVLPTCIDLREVPNVAPGAPSDPPAIGWIGTPSNLGYLRDISPALAALASRSPFVLRIISDAKIARNMFADAPFPVEIIPWNARTAVRDLRRLSVGVMPLPDGDWERYKCGFKLLQYMACGLPAVASPVGANADIITPDANGLWAVRQEDWTAQLERLLLDPALRARLGEAARRTVEARYSIDGHVATLAAALTGRAQTPHA